MDAVLGPGNGLLQYIAVVLVYAALALVMRYAHPTVEPGFSRTFWMLFVAWSIGTFVGNYLLFLAGVMSFLPWLNNFLHTAVWIGLGLGFLYAGAYRRPLWEQFALFAIFSLIVKVAEHDLLGTWELDRFFFIPGNPAYILGWSLADGLYPVLSGLGLKLVSGFVAGLVVPPWLGGGGDAGAARSAALAEG
jgi:hypothetical protein